MCDKFLSRIYNNTFFQRLKQREVVSSVKQLLFSSQNDSMYATQRSEAFKQKLYFACFETKVDSQILWCRISESTSSQWMLYLKILGTSIGFFRENIFKIDIRTTLS